MNDKMRLPKVRIFTDGACSGNPGPGGWAAILRADLRSEQALGGVRGKELCGSTPETTNNRVEMLGPIYALSALQCRSSVDLYTDSQYVQKGITEWIYKWKVRKWRTSGGETPVKNSDLWQILDEVAAAHKVRWFWIKGHAGNRYNERADALARAAIAQMRDTGKAIDCAVRLLD